MNTLNKSVILALTSLFTGAVALNAEAAGDPGQQGKAFAYGKTSDAGNIIFRIENIKPIKNKSGDIKQCSYVVTVYNRLDMPIKEANLNFTWYDNITGQYIQKMEESMKIETDELTDQLDSDAKELNKNVRSAPQKTSVQFQPITSAVKFFSIAPHAQKSFSFNVETDKCFLLFDNLNFNVKDCIYEGQVLPKKNDHKAKMATCANKFEYIDSKNPEYYVEFNDIPENVVQEQIEEEKNQELSNVNNGFNEVMATIDKLDNILRNMR